MVHFFLTEEKKKKRERELNVQLPEMKIHCQRVVLQGGSKCAEILKDEWKRHPSHNYILLFAGKKPRLKSIPTAFDGVAGEVCSFQRMHRRCWTKSCDQSQQRETLTCDSWHLFVRIRGCATIIDALLECRMSRSWKLLPVSSPGRLPVDFPSLCLDFTTETHISKGELALKRLSAALLCQETKEETANGKAVISTHRLHLESKEGAYGNLTLKPFKLPNKPVITRNSWMPIY